MYCEKCGNKLIEEAKFCDKCGTSIGKNIAKDLEETKSVKLEDTTVLFQVKPTFKFGYFMLGIIILPIIILLFGTFIVVASYMGNEADFSYVLANFAMWYIVLFILYIFITSWFVKKQYQAFEYNFYRTKLIYHDSFINITEKEIKYKYIREVQMFQSFIQRWFNIGNIVMYTNAESGMGNGISLVSVSNPKETYDKIKVIINGGN